MPSTSASTSPLLKPEKPTAAMARMPNRPVMARSMTDMTSVELSATAIGSANFVIVFIRPVVSTKNPFLLFLVGNGLDPARMPTGSWIGLGGVWADV
jgi:hypothetical protein